MSCLFRHLRSQILDQTNHLTQYRTISTTNVLLAEPPRKKIRIDPAILRARVERKIRKTEREIDRIERQPPQPIPLFEYQPTGKEIKDLKSRPIHGLESVNITPQNIKAANKLWTLYRTIQSKNERYHLKRVMDAQQFALETLKKIDRKLYDNTVALDDLSLIPYRSTHIRKETGPIPNYKPPDGTITDITKVWIM